MGKTQSILTMTTAEISDEELALLTQWCNGYVMALVGHDSLKDTWDEWCAFDENWDVNFYRTHSKLIKAIAYRVIKRHEDGNWELQSSKWVTVNRYDEHGKPKRKPRQ